MKTAKREHFPTLKEILNGAGHHAAESGWDLRKTMAYVLDCVEDYDMYLAEEVRFILTVTEKNEEEDDARDAMRDAVNEWEGRNNG